MYETSIAALEASKAARIDSLAALARKLDHASTILTEAAWGDSNCEAECAALEHVLRPIEPELAAIIQEIEPLASINEVWRY